MISPPNGYINTSYVRVKEEKIESMSSMKLLGYVFGTEPNAAAHISEIKKKFRARFWSLVHLRKSGFSGRELMGLFNVFIRPIIEYCCVIYHPLLTVSQSNDIERMQKKAVKLAFGWDLNYEEVCAAQDIKSLKTRREEYIDRFVVKTLMNERFATNWFPQRPTNDYNIRNVKPYKETNSRTKRFFNSPLSYMRRRANILYQESRQNVLDGI